MAVDSRGQLYDHNTGGKLTDIQQDETFRHELARKSSFLQRTQSQYYKAWRDFPCYLKSFLIFLVHCRPYIRKQICRSHGRQRWRAVFHQFKKHTNRYIVMNFKNKLIHISLYLKTFYNLLAHGFIHSQVHAFLRSMLI